jgi:hypothetical protein
MRCVNIRKRDAPARHTHGGTETTIDLEDSKLVQRLWASRLGQLIVRDDLVARRRFDAIPIAGASVGAISRLWRVGSTYSSWHLAFSVK